MLVAGSLVGTSSFMNEYLSNLVQSITQQIEQITHSVHSFDGDPTKCITLQTAYYILRLCIGSQFTHILRTTPPSITSTFANILDSALYNGVISIANLTHLESNCSNIKISEIVNR